MDSAREYREYLEQQQTRTVGISSDLKRLKADSGATAAELREFLSHLKGRSPQEVMGVVAKSNLFRSILTATVGCVVLLVVFTIVPYALKGGSPGIKEKKPAAVAEPVGETQAATAQAAASPVEQSAGTPSGPDLQRAAEAMGIGGTADADPKKNPLDNKLDKLLDGLE